jgi:hypothetical protein
MADFWEGINEEIDYQCHETIRNAIRTPEPNDTSGL